jgi:hypothetical protein
MQYKKHDQDRDHSLSWQTEWRDIDEVGLGLGLGLGLDGRDTVSTSALYSKIIRALYL